MDHNDIRHALTDYLDGSLGPEDRDAVEEHLKACSSCAGALAELRKTLEHLRSLDQVDSPAWLTQKIMANVREEAEMKKKPVFDWLFRRVSFPVEVLGVALLAVTVLFVYRNMQPGNLPVEQAPVRTEAPALAPKEKSATKNVAPPASAVPQRREYKALDMKQEYQPPAPPVPDTQPAAAAGAVPLKDGVSESFQAPPQAAPESRLSNGARAVQNESVEPGKKMKSAAEDGMILLRIRARGKVSSERIEEAVREAGGLVISRSNSSDVWEMTLEVDRSKHEAFLDALRRIGRTEERTLAIDGREGLEILVNGVKNKAAVGC